jgi:hypothetical protein
VLGLNGEATVYGILPDPCRSGHRADCEGNNGAPEDAPLWTFIEESERRASMRDRRERPWSKPTRSLERRS